MLDLRSADTYLYHAYLDLLAIQTLAKNNKLPRKFILSVIRNNIYTLECVMQYICNAGEKLSDPNSNYIWGNYKETSSEQHEKCLESKCEEFLRIIANHKQNKQ